jgi:CBS domain-containing protein
MSLKTILAAKGDKIICIEPTADLAAAAKLLSAHLIGALVVVAMPVTTVLASGLDELLDLGAGEIAPSAVN